MSRSEHDIALEYLLEVQGKVNRKSDEIQRNWRHGKYSAKTGETGRKLKAANRLEQYGPQQYIKSVKRREERQK